MVLTKTHHGHTQAIVPLQVRPEHKALPSITGHILSREAGTVFYGHYSMDYQLPGGDLLRLIANHGTNNMQIFLLTHDQAKLDLLPSARPCSLVANAMNLIQAYRIRSDHYSQPRSIAQMAKYQCATDGIKKLRQLLEQERKLSCTDYSGQEKLRRDVISIIEYCRDKNRLLANNPVISEGELGNILYDTRQAAQHYTFHRAHQVTRIDQLDFSEHPALDNRDTPACFVWDSEIHIGHNQLQLDNAIREICRLYGLSPAQTLDDIPANRFKRFENFFIKLWHDARDWADYLALKQKPSHHYHTILKRAGILKTTISPYYKLEGIEQKGYDSLGSLVFSITGAYTQPLRAANVKQAEKRLSPMNNNHWAIIEGSHQIIIRLHDQKILLNYFSHNDLFFPLPSGQDLASLSQISKRHLYFPEKIRLQTKAFFSRIPDFFKHFYQKISQFIVNDLYRDFEKNLHKGHPRYTRPAAEAPLLLDADPSLSIKKILQKHGLLSNGQTLDEFIQSQIKTSNLVIIKSEHLPDPVAYTNPFHRTLGIGRHLIQIFIDPNERNPIIGTLALAAYAYGAGAVAAPEALTALLSKLHLKGLIHGIKPTQRLGASMSHGVYSEATSAAVTYWQAIITGGNLDRFFVDAIGVLKDNPAEVAIITALAMSLGYGLCEGIPALKKEMGSFPYPNYMAAGAKGGAAIYDTVMHPGDDWLLGTSKWLLKNLMLITKIAISPFIEGFYYGWHDGFLHGWKKSGALALESLKETLVAASDLLLLILTLPLIEGCSLFIHVPFRGLTNLVAKTFSTLAHWEDIGQSLLDFAQRSPGRNYLQGLRLSPLYGFSSPFGHYSDNKCLNVIFNAGMLILKPAFEMIKNVLLLPLSDILSFAARLILELGNPVSRFSAKFCGKALVTTGHVWDRSAGLIFHYSAMGLIHVTNGIDRQAGRLRQYLLSSIEIGRRQIFHWAFAEEERKSPANVLSDADYFFDHLERSEKIPHNPEDCLLNILLSSNSERPTSSATVSPDQSSPAIFLNHRQKAVNNDSVSQLQMPPTGFNIMSSN